VPSGPDDATQAVGDGTLDFALNFVSSLTAAIDRGAAITVLAGIHAGCFGLFGREVIRGIADLKGRSVAVGSMGGPAQLFVAAMASQVGIDPGTDIHWVAAPGRASIELFINGKADAFLGIHLSRRSYGLGRSGTWLSIAQSTALGPNISVACFMAIQTMSKNTQ
jgi:ABC-type nitrate/sulfonate/bicarbonate transport system substrate-binding protein